MLQRPDTCAPCKLHYAHFGFCPDYYPPAPVLAMCLEAPGADEVQNGVPLSGRTGELWEKKLLAPLGYQREDVLIVNTIRCRPPNNQYPKGNVAIHAQQLCRQYDDVHGPVDCDGTLIPGGIRKFDPNLFMITEHPAALFRSPAMTRMIMRHMDKAFAKAKDGWRVCILMGAQAMHLVAPELTGGIKHWHGHYFEGSWPGTQPEKGLKRI